MAIRLVLLDLARPAPKGSSLGHGNTERLASAQFRLKFPLPLSSKCSLILHTTLEPYQTNTPTHQFKVGVQDVRTTYTIGKPHLPRGWIGKQVSSSTLNAGLFRERDGLHARVQGAGQKGKVQSVGLSPNQKKLPKKKKKRGRE